MPLVHLSPDKAAWRCAWCGRLYPVESMARDCEDKHDSE